MFVAGGVGPAPTAPAPAPSKQKGPKRKRKPPSLMPKREPTSIASHLPNFLLASCQALGIPVPDKFPWPKAQPPKLEPAKQTPQGSTGISSSNSSTSSWFPAPQPTQMPTQHTQPHIQPPPPARTQEATPVTQESSISQEQSPQGIAGGSLPSTSQESEMGGPPPLTSSSFAHLVSRAFTLVRITT